MTLRLRARYFYILFVLLGIGLLFVLSYVVHAGRQTDRDLQTMVETRAIVTEVRTAGFEYVMSREVRPQVQIRKGMEAIRTHLDELKSSPSFLAGEAELHPLWDEAVSNLQDCGQLLDQLPVAPDNPALLERDRRTINLFLLRSLALVVSIDVMESHLLQSISKQHEFFRTVLTTAFFGLLLLMAAGLILLQQAVLRPLDEMATTVRAVSEGNLDLRMRRSERDEFGQLALAFDHMLDEIAIMTVSRDRLEAEVQERARAEAEAREAYRRLQESQERMVQMEKLSALGTLVGGVAHEINNPLMGIRSYLEYAIDRSGEGRPREMLLRASREVERIGRIVKNMLVFVRSQSPGANDRMELQTVVQNAVSLVEADLRHLDIELDLSVPREPLIAQGNPDNLQQALLNLLLNARDALREKPPPRHIGIALRGSGDGHCLLSVTDNGPGIPEKIRSRIFDPFFTTKAAGQGTGLGLSVTQQLVETCGGTIGLGEPLREGASFEITLKGVEKGSA